MWFERNVGFESSMSIVLSGISRRVCDAKYREIDQLACYIPLHGRSFFGLAEDI